MGSLYCHTMSLRKVGATLRLYSESPRGRFRSAMAASPHRFAQLLTESVYHIRRRESKRIQVVQDELGYALGRAGGSVIEYWRKGHLPATHQDIEGLACELMRRGGFDDAWLTQFLASAGY